MTTTTTRQYTAATVGHGIAVHALRGSFSEGDRLTHDSIRCGAGRYRSAGTVRGTTVKLSDQQVTCKRCITITESDAIWAGRTTPEPAEVKQEPKPAAETTLTSTTTATVPAMYQQNGFNFTTVAAAKVPIGCLALVDRATVMQVTGYTFEDGEQAQLVDAAGETLTVSIGKVQPIIGTDERHNFDLGHGYGVWLRTGETLLRFSVFEGALCATRQEDGSRCGKPLAMRICCWPKRITDGAYRPGPWKLGEDAFGGSGSWLYHADGTPCGEPYHDGWKLKVRDCLPIPRCPKCQQLDTLEVALGAYGNTTTCTTEGCDYDHYYDIGD